MALSQNEQAPLGFRFSLKRFPFLFVLLFLFLVTPCLVVAVPPCMEWISIIEIIMMIREYNLEFHGSVRILEKRALFMKFYPEILEVTQKCVKITLILAKRALFVKCCRWQRLTTGRWFFLDYSSGNKKWGVSKGLQVIAQLNIKLPLNIKWN